MTIVRLCRSRFSPKDATGSKIAGGRWNSPGTEALYASSSLALACLEVLVHLRDTNLVPIDYVFCEITLEDALVEPWSLSGDDALAKIESPILSREFGDQYLDPAGPGKVEELLTESWLSPTDPVYAGIIEDIRKRKPVCAVPSVIIRREMNYLINPNHPTFDQLVWSDPEPFRFDPRLMGSATQ